MGNRIINQQALLDELEKQTEQHLSDAISIFQNLNEETLTKPAANGGWSIAQCLWHLNSYGHYYLPLINTSLQAAPDSINNSNFKPGLIGNYFTRLMAPGPETKNMKAAARHTPVPITDPYAQVAEFIQQQETLLQYLRLARNKHLGKSNVPTSILTLIKLNTGDALRFVITHNQRHVLQAKRNLPEQLSH